MFYKKIDEINQITKIVLNIQIQDHNFFYGALYAEFMTYKYF